MTNYNTVQDYERKPVTKKTTTTTPQVHGFILLTEAQTNYRNGRTFSEGDQSTAAKCGVEASEYLA